MNIKTIALTGTEVKAEFSGGNAWLRNDSTDTVYAGKSAGITAGADGVVAVPAGQSAPVYGANGTKGSYNYSPAYIQIEVCEDDLTDREYFERAFALAADLCKRLMKNYPSIKPENIISHHEAHLRGYASNHADCDHWLSRFGRDMGWFRAQVSGEPVKVTATKDVPAEELGGTLQLLRENGFQVTRG